MAIKTTNIVLASDLAVGDRIAMPHVHKDGHPYVTIETVTEVIEVTNIDIEIHTAWKYKGQVSDHHSDYRVKFLDVFVKI